MAKTNEYTRRKNIRLNAKYEELRKQLPDFVITWLNSKVDLAKSSRVAYARDILRYLNFVMDAVDGISAVSTRELTLADITDDINDAAHNLFGTDFFNAYIHYLQECDIDRFTGNDINSVNRKLIPIRAIYLFYCNRGDIRINPMANYRRLKEPEDKIITHLTTDDVKALFDAVEYAEGMKMSAHQKAYREKTRKRDIAIITLFLGTGIRVSELAGADLSHLDFKENKLAVIRKGAHGDRVYFNEKVASVLKDYIYTERNNIVANTDEEPLFYSLQGKRISINAIENLVKKYTSPIIEGGFSPHKLRATYGTSLYMATGDLGLVQDALGHSSPTTTKKFYVNSREENLKKAAATDLYRD